MLVEVQRVATKAADKPPEIATEYPDPQEIVRVQEVAVRGIDEPCSRLQVGEEWIVCVGEMEVFVKAANLIFAAPEAEVSHGG